MATESCGVPASVEGDRQSAEDVRGKGDAERNDAEGKKKRVPPRKFGDIMEKLDVIINDMKADDGPAPINLGFIGAHDAKRARRAPLSRQDVQVCGSVHWRVSSAHVLSGQSFALSVSIWDTHISLLIPL